MEQSASSERNGGNSFVARPAAPQSAPQPMSFPASDANDGGSPKRIPARRSSGEIAAMMNGLHFLTHEQIPGWEYKETVRGPRFLNCITRRGQRIDPRSGLLAEFTDPRTGHPVAPANSADQERYHAAINEAFDDLASPFHILKKLHKLLPSGWHPLYDSDGHSFFFVVQTPKGLLLTEECPDQETEQIVMQHYSKALPRECTSSVKPNPEWFHPPTYQAAEDLARTLVLPTNPLRYYEVFEFQRALDSRLPMRHGIQVTPPKGPFSSDNTATLPQAQQAVDSYIDAYGIKVFLETLPPRLRDARMAFSAGIYTLAEPISQDDLYELINFVLHEDELDEVWSPSVSPDNRVFFTNFNDQNYHFEAPTCLTAALANAFEASHGHEASLVGVQGYPDLRIKMHPTIEDVLGSGMLPLDWHVFTREDDGNDRLWFCRHGNQDHCSDVDPRTGLRSPPSRNPTTSYKFSEYWKALHDAVYLEFGNPPPCRLLDTLRLALADTEWIPLYDPLNHQVMFMLRKERHPQKVITDAPTPRCLEIMQQHRRDFPLVYKGKPPLKLYTKEENLGYHPVEGFPGWEKVTGAPGGIFYFHGEKRKVSWTLPGNGGNEGEDKDSDDQEPVGVQWVEVKNVLSQVNRRLYEIGLIDGWKMEYDLKVGVFYFTVEMLKGKPQETLLSPTSDITMFLQDYYEDNRNPIPDPQRVAKRFRDSNSIPLPDCWVSVENIMGLVYYENTSTGETCTNRPVLMDDMEMTPLPNDEEPEGWICRRNMRTDFSFYYHPQSGKTSWTVPEESCYSKCFKSRDKGSTGHFVAGILLPVCLYGLIRAFRPYRLFFYPYLQSNGVTTTAFSHMYALQNAVVILFLIPFGKLTGAVGYKWMILMEVLLHLSARWLFIQHEQQLLPSVSTAVITIPTVLSFYIGHGVQGLAYAVDQAYYWYPGTLVHGDAREQIMMSFCTAAAAIGTCVAAKFGQAYYNQHHPVSDLLRWSMAVLAVGGLLGVLLFPRNSDVDPAILAERRKREEEEEEEEEEESKHGDERKFAVTLSPERKMPSDQQQQQLLLATDAPSMKRRRGRCCPCTAKDVEEQSDAVAMVKPVKTTWSVMRSAYWEDPKRSLWYTTYMLYLFLFFSVDGFISAYLMELQPNLDTFGDLDFEAQIAQMAGNLTPILTNALRKSNRRWRDVSENLVLNVICLGSLVMLSWSPNGDVASTCYLAFMFFGNWLLTLSASRALNAIDKDRSFHGDMANTATMVATAMILVMNMVMPLFRGSTVRHRYYLFVAVAALNLLLAIRRGCRLGNEKRDDENNDDPNRVYEGDDKRFNEEQKIAKLIRRNKPKLYDSTDSEEDVGETESQQVGEPTLTQSKRQLKQEKEAKVQRTRGLNFVPHRAESKDSGSQNASPATNAIEVTQSEEDAQSNDESMGCMTICCPWRENRRGPSSRTRVANKANVSSASSRGNDGQGPNYTVDLVE